MQKLITEHLGKLVEEGTALNNSRQGGMWFAKVTAFLQSALSPDEKDRFSNLRTDDFWEMHALRLGHLQGLIARSESEIATTQPSAAEYPSPKSGIQPLPIDSRKIFVVHGHDNEAKEGTARFLEKLGLQPIILHEQASSGRTVIEKFETYSGDIAFAVVLLTPDDVGAIAGNQSSLSPRARQNVIMELGYFMGRLGRVRVCALYKGDVELPSDYQGVLYIEMDPAGAWKTKLAQEFVQAKLPIDLNGLLGG